MKIWRKSIINLVDNNAIGHNNCLVNFEALNMNWFTMIFESCAITDNKNVKE